MGAEGDGEHGFGDAGAAWGACDGLVVADGGVPCGEHGGSDAVVGHGGDVGIDQGVAVVAEGCDGVVLDLLDLGEWVVEFGCEDEVICCAGPDEGGGEYADGEVVEGGTKGGLVLGDATDVAGLVG